MEHCSKKENIKYKSSIPYIMSLDILEQLFDGKTLAVLRVFYSNPELEFYIRGLSRQSKVPLATTFRIVKKIQTLGLIREIKIAKFKVYVLADNENTRFLGQFIKKQKQALQVFITKIKNLKGLEKIMLQGKEEKSSANVVLLGVGLDQMKIKKICSEIKTELNYIVSPLAVSEEQFAQMQQMYPIKTKILFEV